MKAGSTGETRPAPLDDHLLLEALGPEGTRQEDLGHPALSEFPLNDVLTDLASGEQRQSPLQRASKYHANARPARGKAGPRIHSRP
jgi:hypothetical protein